MAEDDETVPNETPEPPSQPMSIPDEAPPPYTPRRCTCPRHPSTGGSQTQTNAREGPNWKAIGGTALVAVAVPTLAVAGAAVVLPLIGFASAGVASGSAAAGIQSMFYGGATCGLFSVFQSVGATIVAPSLLSTATADGAAIAGGVGIHSGIKKSGEGGGESSGADGGDGGGQGAAQVQCACAACVCDESCECACRRRPRRGRV